MRVCVCVLSSADVSRMSGGGSINTASLSSVKCIESGGFFLLL